MNDDIKTLRSIAEKLEHVGRPKTNYSSNELERLIKAAHYIIKGYPKLEDFATDLIKLIPVPSESMEFMNTLNKADGIIYTSIEILRESD